jgi:uncharacterized C2H2 Zn-finger protein
LGSWSTSVDGPRLDVIRKSTQIRIAARPLQRPILGNGGLKVKDKMLLANSLIFSKGLYAAGAWPALLGTELRVLNGAMMVVYRSIASEQRWKKSKCSDYDVLTKLGADTVVVTLRRKRFGLLVRLIQRKAWEVLVPAMLAKATKGTWMRAIDADLAWAATRTVALSSFEGANFARWAQAISHDPTHLLKLLNLACDVKEDKAEAACEAPADGEERMTCTECQRVFFNSKTLATHRANAHGTLRLAARYAPIDGTCLICLAKYGSRSQCVEHLGRSHTCMSNMILFGEPLLGDDLEAAQALLKDESKRARALGLRLTASSKAFVQCLGPVRPIIRPVDAPRRDWKKPMMHALSCAVVLNMPFAKIGGVSSADPQEIRLQMLHMLGAEQRLLWALHN